MADVLPAPIEVALAIGEALDELGIGYFLGGSLASSMQGEPRATNGIDLVVDLRAEKVEALARCLGPEFDVDEDALRDAARNLGSWNLFHLPTALRIDVFVKRHGAFDEEEFERRRRVHIAPGRELSVKSPEDTVLRKLWYREGGEVPQQQWRDVVEVLRTSGPELDGTYLARWAPRLGIEDLLARARVEAG